MTQLFHESKFIQFLINYLWDELENGFENPKNQCTKITRYKKNGKKQL